MLIRFTYFPLHYARFVIKIEKSEKKCPRFDNNSSNQCCEQLTRLSITMILFFAPQKCTLVESSNPSLQRRIRGWTDKEPINGFANESRWMFFEKQVYFVLYTVFVLMCFSTTELKRYSVIVFCIYSTGIRGKLFGDWNLIWLFVWTEREHLHGTSEREGALKENYIHDFVNFWQSENKHDF